jgi:hypothetical protein
MPPPALVEAYPRDWDPRPYRGENGGTPHVRPRAAYAATITALDSHVGRIMAALERKRLDRDTILVFTSGNGPAHRGRNPGFGMGGVDTDFFASTAGLRGAKGSLYEGGIRVPCIVRWPVHFPAGVTSDFPGYAADLLPTLCAAAGLKAPQGMDGINLLPALTGTAKQHLRNPMVWVLPGYGGQIAVRMGPWKIIRQGLRTATPGPWEVYDLVADPGEGQDLAAQQAGRISQAEEILHAQMERNPLPAFRLIDTERGRELRTRIEAEARKGNLSKVDLAAVSDVAWDELRILGPRTSDEVVGERTRLPAPLVWDIALADRNDVCLLVFVKAGTVVSYLEYPRNEVDFSPSARIEPYPRAKAVFTVIGTADGRTALVPVSR